MRSNAPASPCWARRMASASVISLVSVRLVRVTVPDGTHPNCGMPPRLLELHSCEVLVPVYNWRHPPRARSHLPRWTDKTLKTPFSLERVHPSRAYIYGDLGLAIQASPERPLVLHLAMRKKMTS